MRRLSFIRRLLYLIPIPIIWIVFGYLGHLRTLENNAMNLHFAVRGPLDSPVKLFYVNRDQLTSQIYGETPFPRALYAHAARASLDRGAKAVFFDFVFSPLTQTAAFKEEFLLSQDLALAEVIQQYPRQVVMAASYANTTLPFADIPSFLPLKYKGATPTEANPRPYDPKLNPHPEAPTFPLWVLNYVTPDGRFNQGWGRSAIINVDVERSHGPEARWVPLYVEVHNEFPSANYALGLIRWQQLQVEDPSLVSFERNTTPAEIIAQLPEEEQKRVRLEDEQKPYEVYYGDELVAAFPKILPQTFYTVAVDLLAASHGLDANAIDFDEHTLRITDLWNDVVLYEIPITDGQIMEINWFSKWISLPPVETSLMEAVETVITLQSILGSDISFNDHPISEVFWNLSEEEAHSFFGTHFREGQPAYGMSPKRALKALMRLNGAPIDPHNPQASMALVMALDDIARSNPSPEAERQLNKWFERIQDAIILCGPTDPILQDIAPTPMESVSVPRVSVHGNALKTIVSGLFLKHPPTWANVVVTLALTFLVTGLAVASGRFTLVYKIAALALVFAYILLSFSAFKYGQWVLPFVEPVGASFSTALVALTIQTIVEERSKKRIRNMFGTYLSPTLVNRMIESGEEPKLGGTECEITAFFSDVQSFSSFSEVLKPQQLVELMNEYLSAMTDILEEEYGTLDKYIGDAIVAMYGAPVEIQDHASRACVSAIRMHKKLDELRQKWRSEGNKWHPLVHKMRIRIGLNRGSCVVGNMGSNKRFNYTMMGDPVNLAARCESGAKSAGVFTLVTSEVVEAARSQLDTLVFRFVDKWKVKGRNQPVDLYELIGFRDDISAETQQCLTIHAQAMDAYFAKDFLKAKSLFEESVKLEPLQPERDPGVYNNPSLVMIERCEEYIVNPPPADWNGVYEMQHK